MVAINTSAIDAPSNVQSAAEQAESEMQIYWYISPLTYLIAGLLLLGC